MGLTPLRECLRHCGGIFANPCGFANPAAVAVPQSGSGQAPSENVASEGRVQRANSPWDAQSAVNTERIRPGMPKGSAAVVPKMPPCTALSAFRGAAVCPRLPPFGAVRPRSARVWRHRLFAFLAPSAAHGGVFGEAVADPPGTDTQVIPRTPSQQLRVGFSGYFPVISNQPCR